MIARIKEVKAKMTHYIEVEDLSFYYDDEPVLSDINFTVSAGEFVMLTGENGAAKSTLLRNVLGLLEPATGHVKIASKNRQGKELTVGYVPQTVSSFNIGFPTTVIELVESGRYPQNRWFKKLNEKDHEHVKLALESVGMWEMRHKKVGELSGGQKQRISLARVFAMDPDLFVLDEPTTGMDIESRKDFYRLLRHNAKVHNKGILMVSHDDLELHSYIDKHIELLRKENCPWRCFSMDS